MLQGQFQILAKHAIQQTESISGSMDDEQIGVNFAGEI